MGLLNFFKKIVEAVDDSGVLDVPLPDLDDTRDSDAPVAQKMSPTQLLNELKKKFASGKIKVDPNDDNIVKIRGTYNGVSTECSIDDNRIELRIKCHVPQLAETAGIDLAWDPDAVENPKDADDDWGDDDQVCVFIGPNVFATADSDVIADVLAPINALDQAVRDDIVKTIGANRYAVFFINANEMQLVFHDELPHLSNPVSRIKEALAHMKQITDKLASPGMIAGINHTEVEAKIVIVTCSHCSCRFNLAMQSKCANCGAGYSE